MRKSLCLASIFISGLLPGAAVASSGLHHPLETADPSTAAAAKFLAWVDQAVANPSFPPVGFAPFHAALAYKLTGKSVYSDLAVSKVDATVTAASAAAKNGVVPAIAMGKYVNLFSGIRDVTFTLQWCGPQVSAKQTAAWRSYCSQAISNVWNAKTAAWYGRAFVWNGFATNDPGNSLYSGFVGATACWALYSGDQGWLNKLNANLWPALMNYFKNLPEGGSQEGTGFGLQLKDLFEAYGIWLASTGTDLQSKSTHCQNSILYWTHATTPDGKCMAPIGDQPQVSTASIGDFNRIVINEAINLNATNARSEAGRWWRQTWYPANVSGFDFDYDLLDLSGTATEPTATSYQAAGAGHYFARSGWNGKATFLDFTCGKYSEGHGHQNHGAFDFWGAGGWLAMTENTLTVSGAHQTTDFHNMLRFARSGVTIPQALGTAGKATVTDDQTTLTANLDLTAMYPRTGITWTRQLQYVRPARLTVTDNYKVPAGVVPYFQLQLPSQPTVTGNSLIAGNLQVIVSNPANATITVQNWTKLSTDAFSGWRVNIAGHAGAGQFVVQLQSANSADPPPSPGSLHHPVETADRSSAAATRFLAWVDEAVANPGDPPYQFSAFHAALAYKLTGDTKYASLAVSTVDATVTAAANSASQGTAPGIADDSYLYVFWGIRDVTFTMQWCAAQISNAQNTAWTSYCQQTVFNLWNCDKATWYGKPYPWSGWGTNFPGNNYYYSFIGATTCWALYRGDAQWLDLMKTDRWPLLFGYLAAIPEGGSREGTGYGTSHKNLFEVYGIWAASTGADIQSTNTHCLNSILYWVHATTPDGQFMAPIGDQARVSNAPIFDYNRVLIDEAVNMNSGSGNAPAGRWWGQTWFPAVTSGFTYMYDLLDVSGTATQPAAISYQAAGAGHYFARSDWTAQASFLDFICGAYSEYHGHQDHGAFDFWGNGSWLAVTENTLTHSGIQQTTDFHNMVRFENAGTIVEQTFGSTATASVTDDSTTLVANLDLTAMYPDTGISWTRRLTYGRPSMLTVSDVCTVPAGVIPYFQLQLPVAPTVTANGFTAGKLQATVQLPANPRITVDTWSALNSDANSGWRVNISDPSGGGQFTVTLQVLP